MQLVAAPTSRAAIFCLPLYLLQWNSISACTAAFLITRPIAFHHPHITSRHFLFWKRNKTSTMTESNLPKDSLETSMASLDLSPIRKFANKHADALFGYIEKVHVEKSSPSSSSPPTFGRFLDAGTGSHSLRWIASVLHRQRLLNETNHGDDAAPLIGMESYTAITADETMRRRVYQEAVELGIASQGHVIIGNWSTGVDRTGRFETNSNKLLLEDQVFDTILVDYLVGAMDGFAPYFQDLILERLSLHLAPGGRMYIIGLQPIPDAVPNNDGNIMCKITKIRDACILLANHRCYREYPVDWIQRHVRRSNLDIVETRQYPIRYDHYTMVKQINVGRSKLRLFPSKALAEEMAGVLDRLEAESLEVTKRQVNGRVTLGFDYVVVAEKQKRGVDDENGDDEKDGVDD